MYLFDRVKYTNLLTFPKNRLHINKEKQIMIESYFRKASWSNYKCNVNKIANLLCGIYMNFL